MSMLGFEGTKDKHGKLRKEAIVYMYEHCENLSGYVMGMTDL
jgi:hypothetical protein